MTENEAMEILRISPEMKKKIPNLAEVYEVAVKALEENQQYRAIGTVEEILNVLENQRIIIVMQHETLKQYRELGTIVEFKALKEKNEPKKALHNGANWYRCPNGCEIHKKQFEKDWYCPKCGQKLDFGKEE